MVLSGAFQECSFFSGCLFRADFGLLFFITPTNTQEHFINNVESAEQTDVTAARAVITKTTSEGVACSLPRPHLPRERPDEFRTFYIWFSICFRSRYAKKWSVISACSYLNLEAFGE